jgi:hypothetical protein
MDVRQAGRRGGLARAAPLTPERRRAIAVFAARTRWLRAKHDDPARPWTVRSATACMCSRCFPRL